MSTLALHHLPTYEHLRGCFQEVKRVLAPGWAVFLMDLARLKRLDSVLFFAYMHRNHQPHVFSLDFERSLRASFLPARFRQNYVDLQFFHRRGGLR